MVMGASKLSHQDSGLEISEIDKDPIQIPVVNSNETGIVEPTPARKDYLQLAGSKVSHGLETFFYKLGLGIASRPWTVILCCFLLAAICGLGMTKFETKDSSAPIWIPENSQVLYNQLWVEEQFPVKIRVNMIIVTADNILSPTALGEILALDQKVKAMTEYNNTISDVYNFDWDSICFRFNDKCFARSILELWNFDAKEVNQFDTTMQIVSYLSSIQKSPVFNDAYKVEDWLGDLAYDVEGKLISAKAAKLIYFLKATSGNELDNTIVAPDLLWESKFIQLGKEYKEKVKNGQTTFNSVDMQAVRSFRDESDQSFQGDVVLLAAGIGIIICYVAVVMGRFNEVEHKVYLALVGVFGIAVAILVSYGLASAIGQFYGPIHPILPFLLFGLGVDDMFVINEAWNNLTEAEKQKDLPERVAIAMKHAGVSITVTSLTNLMAFSIGCTTALPALRSFCVYAALGILFLFIVQSTFFVAWLTIDQRRQDAYRDACCICIKYYNFEPNTCSQKDILPHIVRKFYAPAIGSLPIKMLVITLAVCLLGISSYGAYRLKTDSDLAWFLPTDSYLTEFLKRYESSFDEGTIANLYLGNVDYLNNHEKIEKLLDELRESEYILPGSISSWHTAFLQWLPSSTAADVAWYYGFSLTEGFPQTDYDYFRLLNAFVGRYEQQYYPSLKWNDTDPYSTRHVEASKIDLRFRRFEETSHEVECLEYLENLTDFYFGKEAFVWSPIFKNWETNRVIGKELYTNLGLAFVAVFIVTLFLVANIWVCLLVCFSVVVSVVNVCGMMHFWGLTIDILTSILLILSIGLAIDYSAHIGHTFMTVAGSHNERAKLTVATIGPAIIHGGFSTFLAFVLLSTSNSYVFITFFKVFFLVVVFGLFNGLVTLPVVLSWIGPAPYLTARHRVLNSNMSLALKDISGSRRTDIDKLLTKNRSYTQTSNKEKVEQYIDGLPESEALVDPKLAEGYSQNEASMDIDDMLNKLELSAAVGQESSRNQHESPRHQVEVHFDDHNSVLADCETYLNRTSQKSSSVN